MASHLASEASSNSEVAFSYTNDVIIPLSPSIHIQILQTDLYTFP